MFGADLSKAHLFGADLRQGDLRQANLDQADLGEVRLIGARASEEQVPALIESIGIISKPANKN